MSDEGLLSCQDTLPDEPMAVGMERFCNGDHVPDDASRVDLRVGPTVWQRLREDIE
jgi:hypothetical protein